MTRALASVAIALAVFTYLDTTGKSDWFWDAVAGIVSAEEEEFTETLRGRWCSLDGNFMLEFAADGVLLEYKAFEGEILPIKVGRYQRAGDRILLRDSEEKGDREEEFAAIVFENTRVAKLAPAWSDDVFRIYRCPGPIIE